VVAFPGDVRPDGIVREVKLEKTADRSIGMQISTSKMSCAGDALGILTLGLAIGDDGVFVQSVSPTGAAAADGVKANDRILSLNGVDTTTITENEITVTNCQLSPLSTQPECLAC